MAEVQERMRRAELEHIRQMEAARRQQDDDIQVIPQENFIQEGPEGPHRPQP